MPERRPYIAANWKMHKTVAEAREFVRELFGLLDDELTAAADVVICPPYLALRAVAELCAEGPVRAGAQNMHPEPQGAFTGEVSAPMLREVGAQVVILGHSERRALFAETDEGLARKVPAALSAGLEPILCVGETEEEREHHETEAVLARQVLTDLAEVPSAELGNVVIAYEPVWAIGTGRTATPEQAEDAMLFIRNLIRRRDDGAAQGMRILYGGSVSPENAAELMAKPDVDGALVGGASLEPERFAAILSAAG